MRISQTDVVRGAVVGLACTAAIGLIVIPIVVWGRDRAPEFFGAFAAAIVAAVAVVIGAYCQATLTRQRDEEIRLAEQNHLALDIYYWLGHASFEMEVIADTLRQVRVSLDQTDKPALDVPLDRYREIVSSEFMSELRLQAKEASLLPLSIAGTVTQALYRCHTVVRRTHSFRAVPDTFKPTSEYIEIHERVTRTEAIRLRTAQARLGEVIGISDPAAIPA